MTTTKIDTSFEEYLKQNSTKAIDFRIRVDFNAKPFIRFYIYPIDVNGTTLDFEVNGNQLACITETTQQ